MLNHKKLQPLQRQDDCNNITMKKHSKNIKDNDFIETKADKSNIITLITRKHYSLKMNMYTKEEFIEFQNPIQNFQPKIIQAMLQPYFHPPKCSHLKNSIPSLLFT